MMEERMERLKNEIVSLKASMPVSGASLDTYFYTKTVSASFPDNTTVNYLMKFIPSNPSEGLGLTEMFEYCEGIATTSPWSQNNPFFLSVLNGYSVDSSGNAVKDGGFTASGYGPFDTKITVAVYSTVEGHIEITFN